MKGSSNSRRRWVVIVTVGLMLVISGCSTPPPSRGQPVSITQQVDKDCDGLARTIQVNFSLLLGIDSPARGDTRVVLSTSQESGNSQTIKRFKGLSGREFSRTVKLTSSDISETGDGFVIQAVAKRSGLFGSRVISSGTSETFGIESLQADSSTLSPSFRYTPTRPNRSEPIVLTGVADDTQCDIVQYRWDIDADGTLERSGREITVDYSRDGVHEVMLEVQDSSGATQQVTKEILVFHDPDGDGITTIREKRAGTDPRDPDTDDDLFPDGIDPMPLSLLVPTGLLHALLVSILYLTSFTYRTEIRVQIRDYFQ